MARILEDMGKVLKDGNVEDAPPKAPEPDKPREESGDFTTMGEHARFKRERKELEEAAKKKAEETPAPAPEKKEEAKPVETSSPAPTKKKIEVERAKPIEEIVEGVVRRIAKEQPAEPAPQPEPPPAKKDETLDTAYIEALDEDQQEAIELAKFAAQAMPDKYGNMPKRMVDYLKKVDSYIEDQRKKDPEWDPEQDEGFSAFIEENQPTYQPGDRKKIERAQIAAEVRGDIEKEFKPKIEATERQARVQELKPEIDKAVDSYQTAVAKRLIPDEKSPFYPLFKDLAKSDAALTEETWEQAKQVDPLAAGIARSYMNQASALGREYLELVTDVSPQVQYNPKLAPGHPQNQKAAVQSRLFAFIDSQEKIFAEQGGDMRVVNGKTFVSRRELAQMSPAEQAKHWTLGHEDVLDMLAVAAAKQAEIALQNEVKRLEEAGYVRNGKHGAAKKEEAAPPAAKKEESPRAVTTPAPGAATPPPSPAAPTVFTEEDLKRSWGGGPAVWKG